MDNENHQDQEQNGITLDSFAVAVNGKIVPLIDFILDVAEVPDDVIVDQLHVNISVSVVIDGEEKELDLSLWNDELPDLDTKDL